jgi:hypothetical protein
MFSNRSLRTLVIENLNLLDKVCYCMRIIDIQFEYHAENSMILIPDEAPINYRFVVKSAQEIKNAL